MPGPVDQSTPMSITLTAGEWNAVLSTLAEGRFNVVSSLIQKIVAQAQGQGNQGQEAAAAAGPRPYLQPAS
jgi:hypothetical protein